MDDLLKNIYATPTPDQVGLSGASITRDVSDGSNVNNSGDNNNNNNICEYIYIFFSCRRENFLGREREGKENLVVKMLGVFSSEIVSPPEELVAAGCRTPSPKITSTALVNRFIQTNASAVSLQVGDHVSMAYTHH
ncbi:hypothetical protein U2117_28810, partial [Klebsiella pneumoniae]